MTDKYLNVGKQVREDIEKGESIIKADQKTDIMVIIMSMNDILLDA